MNARNGQSMSILKVENLALHYRTRDGPVRAVDAINFTLEKGHTLALVGESGSGKTSTANAILRLLPRNVDRYDGTVMFDGTDVMKLTDEEFRKGVRWRGISMVFQGAMNALNPTARVGSQVAEPLKIHLSIEDEEAEDRASESLRSVGLADYVERSYPHELSGGMKQRAIIAMALILKPNIVILDEPTSALDVMTQANIINLLKRVKREEGLSYLFITHDLSLASELADEVGIMYAGELVEIGPAEKIYKDPQHPYTQALLASVPKLRSSEAPVSIPGVPPDLIRPPDGCRFHPRCAVAFDQCGWRADEIARVLESAFQEGEAAQSLPPLAPIRVEDDLTVSVRPTGGNALQAALALVREILSSERERRRGLQGVQDVGIEDGAIVLRLHEGKVPTLIGGDQKASCLLLEKEGGDREDGAE